MKKTLLASLVVGAVAGVVFFNGNEAHASETDGVWTPRTVEQIKADIAKAKGNKYTIVWGDTLSAISGATNITVQKLADMNKIANVDLIYAGNTLVFEGNVATVQNKQGETIAQTVIQPKDKNDASKPVGKQEPAKQAGEKAQEKTASSQSQNKQGTTATSGKADTNSQGTSASSSGTNGSQNGTNSSTGETVVPGNVETPAQPSKPATPSQPADNQPTQPSKGEDQGGSTIPVIDPSTVTDQEPLPEMIGNSGKVFNSRDEANNYGYAEIEREDSEYSGFWVEQLVNKNAEPLNKFTVDFYKDSPLD